MGRDVTYSVRVFRCEENDGPTYLRHGPESSLTELSDEEIEELDPARKQQILKSLERVRKLVS